MNLKLTKNIWFCSHLETLQKALINMTNNDFLQIRGIERHDARTSLQSSEICSQQNDSVSRGKRQCFYSYFIFLLIVFTFQSEPFLHPVSDKEFPAYKTYIIQPMDLTKLEKNIKNNLYGSTQAFEADAKWILHNSIIFNSSKYA